MEFLAESSAPNLTPSRDDIVAAFAPRPVIFTEGGLDRDFHKVKKAYEIMGASENMEYHHYPKFENAMRTDLKSLPEGLNAEKPIWNCLMLIRF